VNKITGYTLIAPRNLIPTEPEAYSPMNMLHLIRMYYRSISIYLAAKNHSMPDKAFGITANLIDR